MRTKSLHFRNKQIVLAILFLTVCIAALSGCAPKKTLAGAWNGTMSISLPGMKQAATVPITFNIVKKDDGKYSATMDVPQKRGIAVDSFTVDGDKVVATAGPAKATYSGSLNSDWTEIAGNFTQGTNSIPLKLTKQPDAKK